MARTQQNTPMEIYKADYMRYKRQGPSKGRARAEQGPGKGPARAGQGPGKGVELFVMLTFRKHCTLSCEMCGQAGWSTWGEPFHLITVENSLTFLTDQI